MTPELLELILGVLAIVSPALHVLRLASTPAGALVLRLLPDTVKAVRALANGELVAALKALLPERKPAPQEPTERHPEIPPPSGEVK